VRWDVRKKRMRKVAKKDSKEWAELKKISGRVSRKVKKAEKIRHKCKRKRKIKSETPAQAGKPAHPHEWVGTQWS